MTPEELCGATPELLEGLKRELGFLAATSATPTVPHTPAKVPDAPPPLPSAVNTREGGTRVGGRVGADTNRKIRISARLDGGELGHRRHRPP